MNKYLIGLIVYFSFHSTVFSAYTANVSGRIQWLKIVVLLMFMLNPMVLHAWEVTGKITRLEPTYSDHLNIRIDANAGACVAGTWLFFHGYGADVLEKKKA